MDKSELTRELTRKIGYEPSKYQIGILEWVLNGEGHGACNAVAGAGKCLGKDTPVLMYDGTIKLVQDIKIGDLLMGDNSTPRLVLATTSGIDRLFRITPVKGDSWVCNSAHILTLINSVTGEIFDIGLDEYLANSGTRRNKDAKLFRVPVEFEAQKAVPLDPYLAGLWLGDGTFKSPDLTNASDFVRDYCTAIVPQYGCELVVREEPHKNTRNLRFRIGVRGKAHSGTPHQIWRILKSFFCVNGEKRVPQAYLTGDRSTRLELLAGLLDTDGYYCNGYFELTTKYSGLKDDVLFLARSLGFAAIESEKTATIKSLGFTSKYWRINICGHIDSIPCQLHTVSRRTQKKDVLRTGFKVEPIGWGEYFGFEIDGNGRFLLKDFTVTHNSSTLRMVALALELLGYKPSEVRVIVFGKENSKDLKAKFGSVWKDSISTLHSCGFGILQHEIGKFGPSERVNGQKYRWIAQELGFVSSRRNPTNQLVREKAIEKPDDLYKMIDLVRLTLSQAKSKDIEQLATHYNIEGILKPAVVAGAVKEILKVGEQQAIQHIIDYTDQIWLPVKWELHKKPWFRTFKFRFVLLDEGQDLNAAQLELVMMLVGEDGRLLAVGDPRQAIFGFSGADNRSYHKIVERTKATELPLSICYRCPRSHIDLVLKQFPQIPIEPRDSAPNGTITAVTESDLDRHLKVGDMILSRKTAPLITRCIKLIAKGVKATVKGRDIGEQIKRDLEDIGRLPGFKYTEFPTFASQYKNLKIQRYIGLDNEEQLIEQLNDKLEALTAIYKARVEATNVAELSAYIDSLFSDEISPVTLSTCHRAKGLEGDRIFILKPEDLPFTWRNQLEWQKEQEDNLLYVALTRSKSELFVVGEPDWLPQKTEEEGSDRKDTLPLELSSVDGDSKEYFAPELDLDDPDFILHTAELRLEDEYGEEDEYDEPTEEEIYAEMDRVAEEDLLPEMAEALKARTKQLSFSPRTETAIGGDRPQTANNLQPGIAETSFALEKPTGRQWISPALITLDAGTQSRAGMNETTVREYAQQMNDGLWQWERSPIPVLFWDGEAFYPGDGHHRIMAAASSERSPDIYCEIREGTARDARFFSCGANRFHGLPRTNADKRNQVELLLRDEEWHKMSDRAIAEHCGVSGPFVGKVRAELARSGTANISSERVDRRGRKLDTANIGAKPKEKPVLGETVEEKIAEILPGVPIEKLEKAFTKYQQLSESDEAAANDAIAAPQKTITDTNGLIEQPTPRLQINPFEKPSAAAVRKVAEAEIALLSQKLGAKVIAEIALDLCTLDEIKTIHADLSANLQALEEED